MASDSPAATKAIVLCLGLLIGFVVGFVLLLSSLPVDNGLTDYDAYTSTDAKPQQRFDFYNLLPNRTIRPDPEPVPMAVVASEIQSVVPATRVVPANAQTLNTNYTEVPANYAGGESYFLQTGKFLRHEEAQGMRAQVLLLGLDAFIVTREEADGSTVHRVRVGPYQDQNLLTEAKKRLRGGGLNYDIVRVTG